MSAGKRAPREKSYALLPVLVERLEQAGFREVQLVGWSHRSAVFIVPGRKGFELKIEPGQMSGWYITATDKECSEPWRPGGPNTSGIASLRSRVGVVRACLELATRPVGDYGIDR